jgi:predicted nucleic acid-binding protein
VAAWLEANRRGLSFVDCTSFEVMRQRGVQQAFAFDGHFEEQGFKVLQP